MLNLNTESLRCPFIPQEEPPQAKKKLKISGENEHVEPSPLNAETIDMLADVIYKLGTSILFFDSGDFVYTILSRNTISDSDEQIKELYARAELEIEDKVDEIPKEELTSSNLLKIIELFSKCLNNYHPDIPTSFDQLIHESREISKATLSGQDTGPLREKLCKAFCVAVREHSQTSFTRHRNNFHRLEMLGESWGGDKQGILDGFYDSLDEHRSFYRKHLPKKVLNQPDVILELASMCSFQSDILNKKARVALATSSD